MAGDGPLRSGWQMKVSIAPSLVVMSSVFSIIAVPPRSPSLRCIPKSSGPAHVFLFLEPPSIVPSSVRPRGDVSPTNLRLGRQGAPTGCGRTPSSRSNQAGNLRRLKALYLDCGEKDQFNLLYGTRRFAQRLNELGIAHRYEEFPDNHSGVDYRMDESLPFLAQVLSG